MKKMLTLLKVPQGEGAHTCIFEKKLNCLPTFPTHIDFKDLLITILDETAVNVYICTYAL